MKNLSINKRTISKLNATVLKSSATTSVVDTSPMTTGVGTMMMNCHAVTLMTW